MYTDGPQETESNWIQRQQHARPQSPLLDWVCVAGGNSGPSFHFEGADICTDFNENEQPID